MTLRAGEPQPDNDGDYWVTDPEGRYKSGCCFHANGADEHGTPWRIRNRKKPEAPALPEGWVERVTTALQDAETVIDYAASILWNCRPEAVALRPAKIDAALRAFRALLAELEPAPPVDPLLVEAREAVARYAESAQGFDAYASAYRNGERDRDSEVQVALTALRRGMELATITQADAGGVK